MQKFIVGFNDLVSKYPKIAKEWHPTKNSLKVEEVPFGSRYKAWWICNRGHEWNVTVSSRTNYKTGCPVCSNKIVKTGFNDFKSLYPKIAEEWDRDLNGSLSPEKVLFSSTKKVWWSHSSDSTTLKHVWESSPSNRAIKKQNCPYCSSVKVLPGFNDLQSYNKLIAGEWHPTKNGKDLPSQILAKSSKKIWWSGKCGHEWEAQVKHRVNGSGCPFCKGQKVLVEFNDLESYNTSIASEIHPTKNFNIDPKKVYKFSRTKIWWLCKSEHEWETTVVSRTKKKTGCPECSQNGTSTVENNFRKELEKYFDYIEEKTVSQKTRVLDSFYQLDILGYIKDKKIVIEYDGSYWHNSKESILRDTTKSNKILLAGYVLVRIREKHNFTLPSLKINHPQYFEVEYVYNSDIKKTIDEIRRILGV